MTWNLSLWGGAGQLTGLPGSWQGEAYGSAGLDPVPTGLTLRTPGSSVGPAGGFGLETSLGIPVVDKLTLEVGLLYHALFAGYSAGSLGFSPRGSADALLGPVSLGLLGIPLQLRYELPEGWSIFAGAAPAAAVLALPVASPSPETDFESRTYDALLRAGFDRELVRWGHDRSLGLALGATLEADSAGYERVAFVTLRLFYGPPGRQIEPTDDLYRDASP